MGRGMRSGMSRGMRSGMRSGMRRMRSRTGAPTGGDAQLQPQRARHGQGSGRGGHGHLQPQGKEVAGVVDAPSVETEEKREGKAGGFPQILHQPPQAELWGHHQGCGRSEGSFDPRGTPGSLPGFFPLFPYM